MATGYMPLPSRGILNQTGCGSAAREAPRSVEGRLRGLIGLDERA